MNLSPVFLLGFRAMFYDIGSHFAHPSKEGEGNNECPNALTSERRQRAQKAFKFTRGSRGDPESCASGLITSTRSPLCPPTPSRWEGEGRSPRRPVHSLRPVCPCFFLGALLCESSCPLGGEGVRHKLGRGDPSLLGGGTHPFLPHQSNATTMTLLLKISIGTISDAPGQGIPALFFQLPLLRGLPFTCSWAELTVTSQLSVLFPGPLPRTQPSFSLLIL